MLTGKRLLSPCFWLTSGISDMADESKLRRSFPLRLSLSMRRQANDFAHREGISLNQFIMLAIAEKIGRMEHATWLKEITKTEPGTTAPPPPPRRE
jgi:hypothetical protein